MTFNPKELVAKVIDYTIKNPYERDYWEKAPALTGILVWEFGEAIAAIQRWMDRAVETQTTEGCLNYSERLELPAGHVSTFTPTASLSASLGYPLLGFYERTKDMRYMEAAQLQAKALFAAPRTSEGGICARTEAPELWVDFLYMMCPFLIRLGKLTGEQKYIDEAFRQYEIHVKYLVDPHVNLSRHAWCERPNHFPQSTLWARGNGWLIACSVDMLAMAPDHEKSAFVADTCRKALTAMRSFQDRSGFFHHILDDRYSKLEASAALMYAYAARMAVQQKIVGDDFIEGATRAWRVVAGSVQDNGAVPGVAVPPGGPGVPFGTTLFGQGFFLLAAHALRGELRI
ncbi:MAG: glycoside hydrolase family 88 protein [Afipia sp.]|nr:glycoside hydrolase family 88 protein [Afipia sp.]